MRVLIVDPMKTPYVKDIGEELADLQEEVGGFIEAVYPFRDEAAIICNEEGKLLGLPLNRGLTGEDGTLCDIVAGTFLVTGLTEDGFGSLLPVGFPALQGEIFLSQQLQPELPAVEQQENCRCRGQEEYDDPQKDSLFFQ